MELQVKARTVLGKKVRALRAAGIIPAEIFGRGLENRHVEVSEKDFTKLYKTAGEHTVITAVTDKGEKIPVLVSAINRDHFTGKFLSIDFHQIRMDEKIQTKIPIRFIGEAPAVKSGLVIVKVIEEVEVESLPGKIPSHLEIALDKMAEIGQSIHVNDLKVPVGVKILSPAGMVVVTVTEKTKEEVEAPKAAAEAAPGETTAPSEAPAEPKPETAGPEKK
ncbi:MAG: 50S ribosomal protein L25 [Candidatus Jorgensenbacteria bacterium GW2011_GWA1_48_11]|uniref:Large ribosomal subunit protein bL25 n=1 Tax=Candidatus Jorgensenbacteria bacterium GW2011_GWA1_48_11 TaxID=1618660 RepID=A0A0G1UBB6_9BACT|nr:MAG: 50S ribosomal protein L25 [Candidatus Jorgensenbacteria bacterium GW2011_GWA1_48_11]KKW11902.1 MAG: 50S ribosomal protein L25 [Candidatus Jorgensenbacteria bacterium GW2011_GWB1_49_9]